MRRFVTVVVRTRLDDVSLSIEPGEVVAFVGETGSGKTSVANLVCGFYDPDSGDVLIDGRSHADVTHEDWRRQVAAVFQDSGLLQRSVRDNVAMLEDVPDDVVLRSLEVTDADAFVRRLRHGLQSQVSLGGDNFSAGQGQRLALARAVVRDALILVLDEATCNLDSHTERKVMDSILEQRRGKTTLLFGHRLSALDRASWVVVLAGGRIVETGTLDELVARNGEFVRLFEAQLAQRRRDLAGCRLRCQHRRPAPASPDSCLAHRIAASRRIADRRRPARQRAPSPSSSVSSRSCQTSELGATGMAALGNSPTAVRRNPAPVWSAAVISSRRRASALVR